MNGKGYSLKKYRVNMVVSRRFQSLKNMNLDNEFEKDRNEFISMMLDNGYQVMVAVVCRNGYFMIGYKKSNNTAISGANCYKVNIDNTIGWLLTYIKWSEFLKITTCSELLDSMNINGNEVKLWEAKETPKEITQKSSNRVYNLKP